MSLQDAVKLIEETGGIPILAHPNESIKGNLIYNLNKIVSVGVKGVEVFSNYHIGEQVDMLLSFVRKNGLIFTSGSDFHGKNKPAIALGKSMVSEAQEKEIIESLIN